MASLTDTYYAAKFIWEWEKHPAFKNVQFADGCRLTDAATMALNARPHGLDSPLILKVPRISQSAKQTTYTLTRDLVHFSKGRFVLQLESPTFEWWTSLPGLYQCIPPTGVLQVSRPQCAATKMMDTVKSEALGVSEGFDVLCFLNNVVTEASSTQEGFFFASLLACYRTWFKTIVCDIFSIADLVNLYVSLNSFRVSVDLVTKPDTPQPHIIDAKDLKTIFVLAPFKFDRDSQLSAASIPDVASLVGRLFAEERLEVTDATLVVWACYPRELVDRGDHSEAAVRSQLRKELEPHIERLRELAPIRVSECGESRRVPPFRKVDLRVCPYEEWHAGGIAEIPVEVWEEVLAGIWADGASSSGASAEARAGEART